MRFKTNDTYSKVYEEIKVVEAEKRRIADNLHDTTLQNLAFFIHKLELTKIYIDSDPEQAKVEITNILNNLSSEVEDVRNHIEFLRPLVFDDISIKNTIEQKLIRMSSDFPINFDYYIEDIDLNILEDKITLFRILQEIVSNSIKHSKCSNISARIYTEDHNIIIEASDDGIGFDTSIKYNLKGEHYGMLGLYDRVNLLNGYIEYNSVIDKGTKVFIRIPYYD